MLKYFVSILPLFMMATPAYNLDLKVPAGIVTTVTSKFFSDYRKSILNIFQSQVQELRLADST